MKFSISPLYYLISTLVLVSRTHAQIDSALGFYPLHKGDYWEYSSFAISYYSGEPPLRYFYHISVTGDTTLSNGKDYYIVECSTGYRTDHPRFQRVDSTTAQVFAFDTLNGGKEYRIDSLRASPNSVFSGCRLFAIDSTTMASIDTLQYFGQPLISRNYSTPDSAGVGPFIEYTLTYSIGLTSIEVGTSTFIPLNLGWVTDSLIYAKINGKEYGTLVSVPQKSAVVAVFKLGQNYPNPFNPTTTIGYQLSAKTDVTLKVYNLLGEEVTTLVDQNQQAGNYQLTFSGGKLPSGVYFYRLTAGPFTETKKLMILK